MYGVFYLASIGKFGEMPDFRQLENPKTNFASEIISSDNQILGKYYFNDNRTPVDYDEINVETVNALICLLYTSPSPRDRTRSRMPSSA